MKLLIFEWAAGTFTYDDIIASFTAKGVTYRTVSYQFNDKNEDEFFVKRFTKVLKDDYYDDINEYNRETIDSDWDDDSDFSWDSFDWGSSDDSWDSGWDSGYDSDWDSDW